MVLNSGGSPVSGGFLPPCWFPCRPFYFLWSSTALCSEPWAATYMKEHTAVEVQEDRREISRSPLCQPVCSVPCPLWWICARSPSLRKLHNMLWDKGETQWREGSNQSNKFSREPSMMCGREHHLETRGDTAAGAPGAFLLVHSRVSNTSLLKQACRTCAFNIFGLK